MESYQGLSVFIQIITFFGAVLIFLRGLEEYRKSNKTKRAEFLEKLIQEFNGQPVELARNILDDFGYPEWNTKTESEYKEYTNLPSVQLKRTLRNHIPDGIINQDEITIREAFDHFLDFITKLSYYARNELISRDELYYFNYYFRRMENPQYAQALSNYIAYYFKRDDFDRLDIKLPPPE